MPATTTYKKPPSHPMTDAERLAVIERLGEMIAILNDKESHLRGALVEINNIRSWASQVLHVVEGHPDGWRATARRHGVALSSLQRWAGEMDELIARLGAETDE